MPSLRQRLNARDESAFTLIELLVVLIIIGVLLAIAIPSYLGFQKQAQQTAAASDVRQAIPSATAFYADNNTYTGVGGTANNGTVLKNTYDSGMQLYAAGNPGILTVKASADGTQYCISGEDNGQFAGVAGPGGTVVSKLSADPCASWTTGVSSPGWTG